jgi:hypothetical protein
MIVPVERFRLSLRVIYKLQTQDAEYIKSYTVVAYHFSGVVLSQILER